MMLHVLWITEDGWIFRDRAGPSPEVLGSLRAHFQASSQAAIHNLGGETKVGRMKRDVGCISSISVVFVNSTSVKEPPSFPFYFRWSPSWYLPHPDSLGPGAVLRKLRSA
jgi:hypothetical protein